MPTSVVMPQMGLEVTEGTVAAIHVAAGARVSAGQALFEVETDKAVTDVVAPHEGVVSALEVEVGDTVAIGATLLVLGGEPPAGRTADGRVRAAPVARRAAQRLGVDLETVSGSGPRGRITLRDVERVADVSRVAPASTNGGERLEALSPTRAAVARRMTLSQQIPQFALSREIDATWLLEQKAALRASANDLLMQAMGEVLLRHPSLATSYVDGDRPQIRHRAGADIGLAVATDRGLLVPVIRAVHERTLAEIGEERRRLVGAARSGRVAAEDMTGAAMTLSNLAGFGVDRFTAMLNPGESSILAVGRVLERVVPRGRGIAIVPTLALTLTIDHRVADGAAGAAALVELADLLEGAMTWRT